MEETSSVAINASARTTGRIGRENALKMEQRCVSQADSLAMENVEKECSDVDLNVNQTIVKIIIEIVGGNALEDGLNAIKPALKAILHVEKNIAGETNIKTSTEIVTDSAFTNPSNVMEPAQLALLNVEVGCALLLTAGSQATTDPVETAVLETIDNAMEPAQKAGKLVETINV